MGHGCHPPQESDLEVNPRLVTIEQQPELADQMNDLSVAAWPTFMLQDPISTQHWGRLNSSFPQCQVAMVEDDRVIGQGNTIPIAWDGQAQDLPDEGWDWAFLRGVEGADRGTKPTTLVGLQIVLDPSCQGRGLAAQFVSHFRQVAETMGMDRLIIPLRPILKHLYPLTPIDRYITWMRGDLPFDPWLRVHVRAGARLIKACHRSMTITGSVAQWEEWTQMSFPESGSYVIPRALIPVEIDCEKDEGIYVEPNVWAEHTVASVEPSEREPAS